MNFDKQYGFLYSYLEGLTRFMSDEEYISKKEMLLEQLRIYLLKLLELEYGSNTPKIHITTFTNKAYNNLLSNRLGLIKVKPIKAV